MTKTIGMILIALGIVGLAWGGFNYTTRETVLNIGPIEATREKTHNVQLPPIAGGLAVVAGLALMMSAKKA